MAYILIFVVLLMIAGPILMLRPSKRDKRLARVRDYALEQGIKIAPVPHKSKHLIAQLERNPHLKGFPWYRYERIASEAVDLTRGVWRQRKNRDGKLVWEADAVLQQTPADIAQILACWEQAQRSEFLLLETTNRSACIVWNEQGDLEAVKKVCDWLVQITQ